MNEDRFLMHLVRLSNLQFQGWDVKPANVIIREHILANAAIECSQDQWNRILAVDDNVIPFSLHAEILSDFDRVR